MPLESNITKSILTYLNSLPNCIAEKVQGNASNSGRADINACYKGWTLRIEVKTPDNGNVPTEAQLHNLRKWYSAGAVIMVVYSLDAVKHFIKYIDGRPYGQSLNEKNNCTSWVEAP